MQSDEQQVYVRERFRDHDRRAEAMEAAAIESANQVLKALLLLNGGACVALLGFLAATFGKPDLADQNLALLSALKLFGWGAAAAVFASAIAYLCNSCYARGLVAYDKTWEWPYLNKSTGSTRNWTTALILNWIGVIAGATSLGLFMCGLYGLNGVY